MFLCKCIHASPSLVEREREGEKNEIGEREEERNGKREKERERERERGGEGEKKKEIGEREGERVGKKANGKGGVVIYEKGKHKEKEKQTKQARKRVVEELESSLLDYSQQLRDMRKDEMELKQARAELRHIEEERERERERERDERRASGPSGCEDVESVRAQTLR